MKNPETVDAQARSWRELLAQAAAKVAAGEWTLDEDHVLVIRLDADLYAVGTACVAIADVEPDDVVVRLAAGPDLSAVAFARVDPATSEASDPVLLPNVRRKTDRLADRLLGRVRAYRSRQDD